MAAEVEGAVAGALPVPSVAALFASDDRALVRVLGTPRFDHAQAQWCLEDTDAGNSLLADDDFSGAQEPPRVWLQLTDEQSASLDGRLSVASDSCASMGTAAARPLVFCIGRVQHVAAGKRRRPGDDDEGGGGLGDESLPGLQLAVDVVTDAPVDVDRWRRAVGVMRAFVRAHIAPI